MDGFELNFGCPHGMCERGMGSAVGQVPEMVEQNTEWVVEVSRSSRDREVDAQYHGHPLHRPGGGQGGAMPISMINTINSLMGVDLDTWRPIPHVDGLGAHGGYCGPAVKPIALHMVAECAPGPGYSRCPSPVSAGFPLGRTRWSLC